MRIKGLKILVISSRDLLKGSTQYRIAQYTDFLTSQGIALEFIRRDALGASTLSKIPEYDVVINQKCLIRTGLSKKILAAGRRTIFDFDDAIYTRPGKPNDPLTAFRIQRRLRLWLQSASVVTAANQVLARYAGQYSSSVVVVPMAVDPDTWKPASRREDRAVTIGWTGAPVNLPNIERLEPVLATILKRHPSARLAISSGRRPALACPFDYHPFHPGQEPNFLQKLDIGLLPLPHDEFARGKSPIKTLQYLACGVPVVGNVFGATQEILNSTNSIAVESDHEWDRALDQLITDRARREALGEAGRRFIMEHHDSKTVGAQLLKVISGDTGEA